MVELKTETQDLIQVKKTKFTSMAYDLGSKELYVELFQDDMVRLVKIPLNKIPQMIRGLFSAYCRFHGKKKRN